jgi:Zn-dependent alcohol dehydrogenase
MNLNKIQFKAAVLFKQKTPLEIISISSNNLKRGQIFIKLFYSGICGSQLGEIMGVKGDDKYLPHLLGHEGVGEVIRTGDGVKKVKKGDIVLMHWMNSEGIESANPSYKYKKLKINAGNLTTFNEFAVVSENKVTKINKNSNYKKKLLLGCTASTAIGSLCKLTTLKKNDAIAVSGCGSIGMMILMICKELKIKNLLAIDISKEKLNFIKKRLKINTVNSKIIDSAVHGRDRVPRRQLRLRGWRRPQYPARRVVLGAGRADGGHRRPQRRRQDHAGQPAAALL